MKGRNLPMSWSSGRDDSVRKRSDSAKRQNLCVRHGYPATSREDSPKPLKAPHRGHELLDGSLNWSCKREAAAFPRESYPCGDAVETTLFEQNLMSGTELYEHPRGRSDQGNTAGNAGNAL